LPWAKPSSLLAQLRTCTRPLPPANAPAPPIGAIVFLPKSTKPSPSKNAITESLSSISTFLL
jgi:hypothetical protein